MGKLYIITGKNEASNNGIIVAVTVVGVLIIGALIVSAIIIKQKKLKCTETDHKVNVSEEIPKYADVAIVQLRSTATPPLPPRMPGTGLETDIMMSGPDVDRNPAYGQGIPSSLEMKSNPAYQRIQT